MDACMHACMASFNEFTGKEAQTVSLPSHRTLSSCSIPFPFHSLLAVLLVTHNHSWTALRAVVPVRRGRRRGHRIVLHEPKEEARR